MAESSLYQTESDQVFEFECDSCKFDGSLEEATGYCVDCQEYLCETCLRFHKRNKASKTHSILQGSNVRQSQIVARPAVTTTETCHIHHNKPILYYCTEHDDIICTDCKITDHRACTGVKKIADICKEENVPRQVDRFEKELKLCLERMHNMQQRGKQELQHIDKQEKDCCKQIKDIRLEINKLLDKLENEINIKVTQAVEKERRNIQEYLTSMDTMVADLEKEQKSMKAARPLGDSETFIAMKRSRLEKKQQLIDDINKETYDIIIDFNVDTQLTHILRDLKQFGEMNIERFRRYPNVRKLDIRCKEDTDTCKIRGCTLFQDNRVLLTDSNNRTLKLFSEAWEVQASIRLKERPWDITSVSSTQAIVSLPVVKMLQYVTVGKQLKLGKQLKVDKQCYGIVHKDGKLYVSCIEDVTKDSKGEIQVLSMTGERLTCIGNASGSCMFKRPFYLTVDKEDRIYVSDRETDILTCITEDGTGIYEYEDTELRYLNGLAVDSQQNVYICSYVSNTIQMINSKGEKVKTLLEAEDGIQGPVTLMYRDSDKSLVVGMYQSDEIAVYQYQ